MLDNRLASLSAQIEKMTPQQRQKFAMLHRSDPIIVSMTKFVNDQENSLRTAMKGQQAAQTLAPKPPVVDEVIQGMAPPAGVGALPAPNLAAMPDGGITGEPQPMPQMAAGGEVPSYAGGGMLNGAFGMPMGSMDTMQPQALYGYSPDAAPAAAPQAMDEAASIEQLLATDTSLGPAERAALQAKLAKLRAPARQAPRPADLPDTNPTDMRLMQSKPVGQPSLPPAPTGIAQVAPQAAPAAATPSVPRPGRPNLGAPTNIPAALQAAYASMPEDPTRADQEDLNERRTASAKKNQEQVEKDEAELGIAGLDREKRLKAKEEKLGKSEESNKAMAIVDAGLAIMAGSSPFALQNIGAGALQGTRAYRAGQEKIDAARDKLDDAFGTLEDVRRSDKYRSQKAKREAMMGVENAMNDGIADLIKGTRDKYKVDMPVAAGMVRDSIMEASSMRQAQASMYHADMGYAGQMGAAGIHATQRNNELKWQTQMGLQANKQIDAAVAAARKADPYGWTQEKEEAVRAQAWQDLLQSNPGLARIGVNAPTGGQPTVNGPMNQGFKVLR